MLEECLDEKEGKSIQQLWEETKNSNHTAMTKINYI